MKTTDLRAKSDTDLQKELNDLLKAHFNMRMQHGTQQLANTAKLGAARRDIARVRTLIRERKSV